MRRKFMVRAAALCLSAAMLSTGGTAVPGGGPRGDA